MNWNPSIWHCRKKSKVSVQNWRKRKGRTRSWRRIKLSREVNLPFQAPPCRATINKVSAQYLLITMVTRDLLYGSLRVIYGCVWVRSFVGLINFLQMDKLSKYLLKSEMIPDCITCLLLGNRLHCIIISVLHALGFLEGLIRSFKNGYIIPLKIKCHRRVPYV